MAAVAHHRYLRSPHALTLGERSAPGGRSLAAGAQGGGLRSVRLSAPQAAALPEAGVPQPRPRPVGMAGGCDRARGYFRVRLRAVLAGNSRSRQCPGGDGRGLRTTTHAAWAQLAVGGRARRIAREHRIGAWILRRFGMPAKTIADSQFNPAYLNTAGDAISLVVCGVGLAIGVFGGEGNPLLTWLPACWRPPATAAPFSLAAAEPKPAPAAEPHHSTASNPSLHSRRRLIPPPEPFSPRKSAGRPSRPPPPPLRRPPPADGLPSERSEPIPSPRSPPY